MKKVFLFPSLILGIVLSPVLYAEEGLPPYQTTVSLRAQGDAEGSQAVLESLIQALREIEGVNFVKGYANWQFDIRVVPAVSEQNGFWAVSVVLLLPFRREFLSPFIKKLDAEEKERWEEVTSELYRFNGHWLETAGPGELPAVCGKIVSEFNTRYILVEKEYYSKMLQARQALQQTAALDTASRQKSRRPRKPEKKQ